MITPSSLKPISLTSLEEGKTYKKRYSLDEESVNLETAKVIRIIKDESGKVKMINLEIASEVDGKLITVRGIIAGDAVTMYEWYDV
jgi:heme oxygenase